AAPVEAPAGAQLKFRIEHQATLPKLCLGHFRLSVTEDPRAAQWGGTPLPVIDALRAAARTPDQEKLLGEYYATIAPELQPTRDKVKELEKQIAAMKPDTVPIMRD